MPGTTRYSATFDRTYEEDDNARHAEAPVTRRSRSQSLQVQSFSENERYRPLANLQHSRSPSADKSQIVPKGSESIPTRTAGKATVKAHNNPFQFVKINTTTLQQKAEQLKKLQVKKPPVVKEDEEEWQSNLDSWKSRRRKMSETAIRRQEELKQFELEDSNNIQSAQSKKTKTFSEMVEQRATRGRALSLCLFSNPLESSEWIFEANKSRPNRVRSQDPLSGESAESSTMNSEDDNDSYTKHEDEDDKNNFFNVNNNTKSHLTNGHTHNGIENSASNSSVSRASELSESEASQNCLSTKERNGYIDSGLESLSSGHRTGDIPDSGSDFSHDSGSSLDCDSPRVSALITTGIELLEEYSSKNEEPFIVKTNCQKQGNSLKESVPTLLNNTSHPVSSSSSSSSERSSTVTKPKMKKVSKTEPKTTKAANIKSSPNVPVKNQNCTKVLPSKTKSVESENEMFVDDFEELEKLKSQQPKESATNVSYDPAKSSLNVIFNSNSEEKSFKKPLQISKSDDSTSSKSSNFSLIGEVPVEKITEEMERLILEQLEEEEKAKEQTSGEKNSNFILPDDKSAIDAPSKCAEPPKEKPPPPPSSSVTNDSKNGNSLNRVNSTKRIIKEINRRRSDFLGIDKTVEENTSSESSVPPPPVLEDLLRAEREQERLRRQILMSKIPAEPFLEEDEISKKEREIIENLETDERLRQVQEMQMNNNELQNIEEVRINQLKEERRIEEERLVAEEQKARLEEARLLQQREEYIRKQEVVNDTAPITTSLSPSSSSSTDAPSTNAVLSSTDNLSQNGDGKNNKDNVSSLSVTDISNTKDAPPATPPKPLPKKKEAIRKERERLRQEQEALQREREEHRLKVQREQEQQKKNAQSPHVPDPPAPRVGPPIPAKPTQLTHSSNTSQVREDTYSNSSCKDSNGNQITGTQSLPTNRQPRNTVARTKARVQQKLPCVRKQQPEPSSEIRYNQNHWLIQEAEMRRIAEQKERQRNNETRFISANQVSYHQKPYVEDYRQGAMSRPANLPLSPNQNSSSYAVPAQLHSPDQHWTYPNAPVRNGVQPSLINIDKMGFSRPADPVSGSAKSLKGIPQEQMLSVSGRKRCSHCGEELGRGAAMIIESLQLYYHIQCFQCCVCQAQLGNGSCGTDVRVRNNKLHCHNCYSNDEAGLKFSQV